MKKNQQETQQEIHSVRQDHDESRHDLPEEQTAAPKDAPKPEAVLPKFFRYQDDCQIYFSRSEQQQRNVSGYFIVPNKVCRRSALWLLIAGIVLMLGGVVFGVMMITSQKGFGMIALGFGIAVLGIVATIIWSKTRHWVAVPDNPMSDAEYDQLVAEKAEELNPVERCYAALHVDEETMKGFEHVCFRNFAIADGTLYVYNESDNKLRSSAYEVTHLYFTDDRILAYSLQFDMCCDKISEITSEIFYKDICDVGTKTISQTQMLNGVKAMRNTTQISIVTSYSRFNINVGDSEEDKESLKILFEQLVLKRK